MVYCPDSEDDVPDPYWVGQHEAAIAPYKKRIEALESALDPRRWTKAQSDAWHRALPDLPAAFAALRDATSPPNAGLSGHGPKE